MRGWRARAGRLRLPDDARVGQLAWPLAAQCAVSLGIDAAAVTGYTPSEEDPVPSLAVVPGDRAFAGDLAFQTHARPRGPPADANGDAVL